MSNPHASQIARNMEALSEPYPGRGIVIGRATSNPDLLMHLYWVMGRSDNSRNRLLVQDGDDVRTAVFDESKVTDPSLIIYRAMAKFKGLNANDYHAVSNGDQTDTIVDTIGRSGGTFGDAMDKRTYEPDAPNYTPRISGLSTIAAKHSVHRFSMISKVDDGDEPIRNQSFFFDKDIAPGTGFAIHTYAGDSLPGEPLPSFSGNPLRVSVGGTVEETAEQYWDLLDKANRVALVVKGISLVDNSTHYTIKNQLG